ncbi:L-type lectin-domain containing receptor kinase IX.1 [Linum grandiflorum]
MAAILPLCCQPPSTSALKFNFTAFTGGDTNITYEEAFPADNAIQLTRNLLGSTLNSSVGRATYNSPLPLWDPISRNLTDFQTHFVFSIFSQLLGLTDGPHALNTTANHFVAVEFDIFSNDFDPLPLVEGDGKEEAFVVHLVEWVWELYGDGRLTMMEGGPDRRLDGEYDVEEMERLLMVGLCCAHPDSSSRPSVRQAVQLLNFEAPVPVLPVNMPVASYGGGDQMREGSFGVSTSTMMTMADADLQRRHVSCDFDGSNGVATSPLGKNGSNNAVTF